MFDVLKIVCMGVWIKIVPCVCIEKCVVYCVWTISVWCELHSVMYSVWTKHYCVDGCMCVCVMRTNSVCVCVWTTICMCDVVCVYVWIVHVGLNRMWMGASCSEVCLWMVCGEDVWTKNCMLWCVWIE